MMITRLPAMISAAIIDDEPLAREGVRVRLERAGGVTLVGECADGAAAAELIRHRRPDVVFIDVQMPGKSGLEVVQSIEPEAAPYFVFITAYDTHAVRAFELNALDYLVKPIADDRFVASLERARTAVQTRGQAALGRRLHAWVGGLEKGQPGVTARAAKLTVRIGNRLILIAPADIDWIEASGDYAQLHVGKKTWLMRESMSALDAKLVPLGFTRIHRSTIVNTDRVVELRALDDGEYTVLLRDGTSLKLSRSYRHAVPALLQAAD
jgi:two-component system LytT family response regulator